MSFLAIDIGNTRLKWACYETTGIDARLLAHGTEFLENIETLSETTWKTLPTPTSMLGCVVASESAKRRTEEQMDIWPHLQPRWVVSREKEAGVSNGYDFPSRLGADRWVALIGARQHMLRKTAGQAARPVVLVMAGTAVTVEAMDADGRFLGGYILPGYGMMLRALGAGTAGLNHLPTGDVVTFPTNTSDAITSGGVFALSGAIERMIKHVSTHCGAQPLCLMTGGAGWKIKPYMETPFELLESLLFDGLLTLASLQPAQKAEDAIA